MNNEVQSGNPGKNYEIQVNGKTLSFQEPKVTGRQILEKAHLNPPECYSLYGKLKDCDFEKISLDELVDISPPRSGAVSDQGTGGFYYTVDKEPETTITKHSVQLKY
ncbi:MAG: multiubiquitin domain-containing protein [Bacteroidota bacterium]